MIEFLKNLESHFRDRRNSPALADAKTGSRMSYGELDEFSGRVYAFLKDKQISINDAVVITTPRSIESIAVMTGIFRTGATCVMLEDDYPQEYMNSIIRDCKAKIIIDTETLVEIRSCRKKEGREQVDPLQSAAIIYTSGSTGEPKGVRHRYEILDMQTEASEEYIRNSHVLGCTTPLYFVAAMMTIVPMLSLGRQVVIIDSETGRNMKLLKEAYEKNNVDTVFLVPSLLRRHPEVVENIKTVFAGGEPLHDLHIPGVTLFNYYSQTEYAVPVLFQVDRQYSNTPVGNVSSRKLIIDFKEPGRGELCIKTSSHSEYVNQPELNDRVYRNGCIHTGDMVTVDGEGNITITGRIDDMVKINGNRIEPGDVAENCRKALGLHEAVACCMNVGKVRTLVLYYTSDSAVDDAQCRGTLMNYMPEYMIPSYYVRLESFPTLHNGKINRRGLPLPEVKEASIEDSPETELERKICSAFSKALGTGRVGADDDFYSIGGDSLSTIDVISMLNEPLLDARVMLTMRTARAIAAYLSEAGQKITEEGLSEEEAEKIDIPLNPFQIENFDAHLCGPELTNNVAALFRMSLDEINADRFRAAIASLIAAHPAFRTKVVFNDEGILVYRHDSSIEYDLEPVSISEQEMQCLIPKITTAHKVCNHRLCRIRFFRTDENLYFYIDFHHTVSDGTSLQIVIRDLSNAYHGKKTEPDLFYRNFYEQYLYTKSREYELDKEYYYERYSGKKYTNNLLTVRTDVRNAMGRIVCEKLFDSESTERFLAKAGLTQNNFVVCVSLMVLHLLTGSDDVMVDWYYNGRDRAEYSNSLGLYVKTLPAAAEFGKYSTAADFFADVRQQMDNAIEHSRYFYSFDGYRPMLNEPLRATYQMDFYLTESLGDIPSEYIEPGSNDFGSDARSCIQLAKRTEDGKSGYGFVWWYIPQIDSEEENREISRLIDKVAMALMEMEW